MTIESRFKVNVLLVPNRHLETPNYSIERLRHDDLNKPSRCRCRSTS
jgi:ribonuclease E